ncbi:hypothetical protein GGP46_003071 [Salinibacter ruber]|nr:hypothetical protein [Salinibacter ruber]
MPTANVRASQPKPTWQAYMGGIGEHEAAMQTRHASLETLWEYQQAHVVMDDHPLSRIGTEKNSAE